MASGEYDRHLRRAQLGGNRPTSAPGRGSDPRPRLTRPRGRNRAPHSQIRDGRPGTRRRRGRLSRRLRPRGGARRRAHPRGRPRAAALRDHRFAGPHRRLQLRRAAEGPVHRQRHVRQARPGHVRAGVGRARPLHGVQGRDRRGGDRRRPHVPRERGRDVRHAADPVRARRVLQPEHPQRRRRSVGARVRQPRADEHRAPGARLHQHRPQVPGVRRPRGEPRRRRQLWHRHAAQVGRPAGRRERLQRRAGLRARRTELLERHELGRRPRADAQPRRGPEHRAELERRRSLPR